MADTVQTIKQLVAAKADTAAALAKEIWNYAELSYEETRSAAALIGALKNEGFTIEEGMPGSPRRSPRRMPSAAASRWWAFSRSMTRSRG